jgi:hypothetical protein
MKVFRIFNYVKGLKICNEKNYIKKFYTKLMRGSDLNLAFITYPYGEADGI